MNMIEAGARAMNHLTACSCEEDETCEECREAARACWTAMAPKWVEGLTDEQCKGIRYSMKCESPANFRAALIEATEVDDD